MLNRINPDLSNAWLSTYIGDRSALGTSVGLTAIRLALRQAFETPALHKVWMTVHVKNAAAIKTYTRLGLSVEGVLCDDFILAGEYLNVLYMGVLAGEYESLQHRRVATERK